ncbi:LuxR family transcriptional regulator [Kitasatospora griseola]|uniref:LuxR family transcriptional regulator n=1 Tax=Kitasatospora griseola TaxID=2064 RepID=A0A0D0PVE4_KITGR|nr:response regulator transcription factor [Kitasatospora griseola]KIQ66479.1 LuxR family transcriptional regulator [Kitasatospora griseola]
MIRVLLVDDQPLVRASLDMIITDAPDLAVVGEAGNGADAVRLAAELRPDIVVMDIRMPGMDGIEATRIITGAGADAPQVLVLTTFDQDEHVYGALQAGASGFLVKDMELDDILAAIRVVAAGNALIAPTVTRRLIAHFARQTAPVAPAAPVTFEALTTREREILTLVGLGRSNAEIAAELHLTVATAKTYISRMLTKLDARDRVQLVIAAYEAGLVGQR